MASIYDRFLPGAGASRLPIHYFIALGCEIRRGKLTNSDAKAKLIAKGFVFDQNELDQMVALVGDTLQKPEDVERVFCLLESGWYTKAEALASLGITE